MKKLVIISILLSLFVGFPSCKKNELSKACDILSFKDGDKEWSFNDLNITAIYPKGSNVSGISPTIEVSKGAKVSPASGAVQDFSDNKEVTYTVTAEDGKTTKKYIARITVSLTQ